MSDARVSGLRHLLIGKFMGSGWGVRQEGERFANITLLSIDRVSLETRINLCLSADPDDPHELDAFLDHYRRLKQQRRNSRMRRPRNPPAWLFVGISRGGVEPNQAAAIHEETYGRFARAEARGGWIYILLVDAAGRCVWKTNPYKYLDELVARWRSSGEGAVAARATG